MKEMTFGKESFGKYVFWGAIVLLVFLSFKIIQPYIVAIISAFILAYLLKPLHDLLRSRMNASVSAILCILIAAVVLLIPLAFVLGMVLRQASEALQFQDVSILFHELSSHPLVSQLHLDVEAIRARGIEVLASLFGFVLSSIPHLALSGLIMLFGVYYMLIHWDELTRVLKSLLPFGNKSEISQELEKTTRVIVRGTLLVATVEFIVGALGFWLSGVSTYILFAAVIFIFAFIPGLGPVAVWAPLALYHFAIQNIPTAIGVLATGLIISIFLDTFLLAKFVGKEVNPFVMLVGVIGGVVLFGVFGFIIGPLILSYTVKLVKEGLEH